MTMPELIDTQKKRNRPENTRRVRDAADEDCGQRRWSVSEPTNRVQADAMRKHPYACAGEAFWSSRSRLMRRAGWPQYVEK